MRGLVLDTSAYSLYFRGHGKVQDILQTVDGIYVTTVSLGELRAGFMGGRHRERNEAILEEFLSSPRVNVMAIDEETARRYSFLITFLKQQGTPIPTNDVWIAAGALQHGFELITSDKHFERIPNLPLHLLGSA
jgi:predicted nucleic acid-binding protein